MSPPLIGTVYCEKCGKHHEVVRSHLGKWDQGWLYKVVCDNRPDWCRGELVAA